MKQPKNADRAEMFAYYWRIITGEFIKVEREFEFCDWRKFRFDFAFPADKIAVEVDGGVSAPGGGRHAKDGDREKLNIAAMLGWRVFRFSPQMLNKNPDDCITQVRKALEVSED